LVGYLGQPGRKHDHSRESDSGPVRTYDVTNAASQQQLSRVKHGDNLTDINSRIAVVSIAPRS
jgi:hypothetical protein